MATFNRAAHRDYSAMPVQAKRGTGGTGMSRYSCSACKIDYQVGDGRKALCPLCDAKAVIESLREQIQNAAQETYMLQGDLERAQTHSSLVGTLREALHIADFEDAAMIKAIAYRWRADPDSLEVMAIRGGGRYQGQTKVMLEICPESGEREHFVPSSVGGVAFVETYDELVRSMGVTKAMQQYVQAIAAKLAS